MYVSYYDFREKPFNLTPDPKYLYLSSRHQEALAHLEYARRERGGFVLLTGEVGAGKTTVARHFLTHLDEAQTATAVVLYPALTAQELLASVLADFKAPAPQGASLKTLVDRLHAFLLEARAAGRDVILLIDEAQDLAPEVLEQVRLISNLETDSEKLIQIVLMGQSELIELLTLPGLRQIAQRITARYHLTGLDRRECEAYIRHRLTVAGGEGKVTFTARALAAVQRASGGIPRVINLLCDRALLAGFVESTRTITADHVRAAAREVNPPRQARGAARWSFDLRWVTLVLALIVGVAYLAAREARRAGPADPLPAMRTAEAAPAPPSRSSPTPQARLAPLLLALDREGSREVALRALRAAWGSGESTLTLTPIESHVDQLRLLDIPLLLEMAHPARRDTCYVGLLGLRGEEATLAPATPSVPGSATDLTTSVAELERFWTRRAIVPWMEDERLATDVGLSAALSRVGQPIQDGDLEGAVTRFQRQVDLVADGEVGPRTLLALYCLTPHERPRLSRPAVLAEHRAP